MFTKIKDLEIGKSRLQFPPFSVVFHKCTLLPPVAGFIPHVKFHTPSGRHQWRAWFTVNWLTTGKSSELQAGAMKFRPEQRTSTKLFEYSEGR